MMLNSRLQAGQNTTKDPLTLKIPDIQKHGNNKEMQSPLVTYHKRDLNKRESSFNHQTHIQEQQHQNNINSVNSSIIINKLTSSQQKPQFLYKQVNSQNQGNGSGLVSLLQKQQTYKTARSSLERIYQSGVIGAKKDNGPVYIENKQFFYDLAFVPAHQQITPVDKETINESVYGKNWREKLLHKNTIINKSQYASSDIYSDHQKSELNFNQLSKQKVQQIVRNQMPVLTSSQVFNHNNKNVSIGDLEETSQCSSIMPHIDLPKKKKNLNEVSSLYISSDDEEDSSDNISQFQRPTSTGYPKSMMSNYSSRLDNMKLNLLTRFRQSKGLLSPQHQSAFNKRSSIEHKEYVIDDINNNDYNLNNYNKYNSTTFNGLDTFTQQYDVKFQVRQKKKLNFSQRISEQAVFDYYRNYKNLKASIEREEHLMYPQSAYISSCEKNNLIPRPYGLVTYKGDDQELNVKNFLMGNKYAKAYSQGLQFLETKKVNVSNNRLDERGTMSVLKGLNKKAVEDVDLSSNKIGYEGIQYLGDLLVQSKQLHQQYDESTSSTSTVKLRVLKLEQTQITDPLAIILINALDQASDQNKSYLQELNLACNKITCIGAEKIAQYIGKNPVTLKVLNLHWNKIKCKGGLKLAEALQNNSNLKVLDLSWNALGNTNVTFAGQLTVGEVKKKLKGQGQFQNQEEAIQQISELERQELETTIGRAWGKALGYNKYLVHLDLSYNCFGSDSCRIMQKKIKKNHTLYGLHLAGNACTVDTHGFIVLPEENQNLLEKTLTTSLQDTQKKQIKPSSKSQSSQTNKQRSYQKKSMNDVPIKSPQKEVLFKRMEGMKAVIKKRNVSYGGNSGLLSPYNNKSNFNNNNSNSNHSESPTLQTQRKGLDEHQRHLMVNQSISSIQQPGAALQKFKVKDNCWICEGWSEFKFDLRVPQHIGAEVYLHFDFDDYRPDLMPAVSAGVYSTWRMVPPGTHYYFMSVNGSDYYTASGSSSSNVVLIDDNQIKHIDHKLQKTFSDKYNKTFNLHKLSFVESLFQQDISTAITPRDLQQISNRLATPSTTMHKTGGRNISPIRNQSSFQKQQQNLDSQRNLLQNNRSSSKMSNNHNNGRTLQIGLSNINNDNHINNNNSSSMTNNYKTSSNTVQSYVASETYSISRIKNCVPRPDKKFMTTKQERPRTPWTFPISIFKEYKPEVPALVNDCFEFDWQCLRKPKLKKCTEEELKEKCREIYPFVREMYKRLAAIGIVGTVFSIGWNVYREFMIQTLNITDKDKLKPDDCDRLFIGVNAGNQRKAPFIPEKALVRFQFLEILMKAAIKRYFESGDVESELDAMDQLSVLNIMPIKSSCEGGLIGSTIAYQYNQHRWRVDRYWNEACDNIMKAFAPLFTHIYNTFGGSHKKPGQKTFMTLDEFDILIQTAGLVNDMLNQRDIALHFNFAMMCQVNEIDYERHLQATYIEFLEAFARVCDQASIVIYSPPPIKGDPTSPKGTIDIDQLNSSTLSPTGAANQNISFPGNTQDYIMTEEERQSLPLHIKIENAIQYLLKNCCSSKGFLDKFDMPKKHPQVGLYILPNKKFF